MSDSKVKIEYARFIFKEKVVCSYEDSKRMKDYAEVELHIYYNDDRFSVKPYDQSGGAFKFSRDYSHNFPLWKAVTKAIDKAIDFAVKELENHKK